MSRLVLILGVVIVIGLVAVGMTAWFSAGQSQPDRTLHYGHENPHFDKGELRDAVSKAAGPGGLPTSGRRSLKDATRLPGAIRAFGAAGLAVLIFTGLALYMRRPE